MALPDEQSLNPVTLHDIFTRLGYLELAQVEGQREIREELAALTIEVRTGLNGGKVSLRERVTTLEGRWNRLVGGFILVVAGVGAFEVWKGFFG